MIGQAQRTIVVADGSKVGRIMLAKICPLTAVTELVTDAAADLPGSVYAIVIRMTASARIAEAGHGQGRAQRRTPIRRR